jgi:hypothetical protein
MRRGRTWCAAGKADARSTPAQHTVVWDGVEEQVTFMRK